MYRESERTEIGILLHKFDLLDEEGRRFNNAAGCVEQAAGVGVQINSASEKSYTLLARFHLVDVHHAAFDHRRRFVGKFIVGAADGGERRIVFLHVINLRLQ